MSVPGWKSCPHLSAPPGVQSRPPAVLSMKPEPVSCLFLLSEWVTERKCHEQPLQTPIKPSLTVDPHPPIFCFAFFSEHLFSADLSLFASVLVHDGLQPRTKKCLSSCPSKKWLRPSRQVQLQHLVLRQQLLCYFSTATVAILPAARSQWQELQQAGSWSEDSVVLPVTARLYDAVWGTLWTLLAALNAGHLHWNRDFSAHLGESYW